MKRGKKKQILFQALKKLLLLKATMNNENYGLMKMRTKRI